MWGSVIDPAPPQPVLRVGGGALGLDGGGVGAANQPVRPPEPSVTSGQSHDPRQRISHIKKT